MSQQQPTENEVEQQQEEQMTIQQLKDSIHLSTNKLLELTYSEEKYINAIVKFNQSAIQHIQREEQEEALVYLAQAERTLEYGASCGKSIDRNLIICILNNEACCYYREGELTKCASYLEGVIYNLKAFATSMDSTPTSSSILQKTKSKTTDEFYHISVQKKIELVHYNLRYCTINSQVNKRDVALKAGKNVVKLIKSLFDDILFQNPKLHPLQTEGFDQQLKELRDLVKTQIFFKEQIDCEQLQTYRKLTRIYVKKWNQKKINNRINRNFEKYIRDYSISQVIQISPVHYNSNSDEIYQSLVNTKLILRQLLHLTMGYFTISTEHRLLAEHRYPNSTEQKQSSEEWKSANILHLMGILFLGINLNCDLLFMKQLISSYQQHYKSQLLIQEQLPDEELQSLSQKLLFQQRKSKHSKQNDILFQKISKLKEKEKQLKNKSKNKDSQYKTLNSTKLNISKEITQKQGRKRSISKNQTSALSSSKKMSQKTSINNSTVNQTKILNNDKPQSRKRSYSKDSIKQSKPIGHLGVQKFNKIERTVNEYQLETPNKMTNPAKKRRISSVSSSKEIGAHPSRQNSKKGKMFQFHQKDKKTIVDKQRMKSPVIGKNVSEKLGKIKIDKSKHSPAQKPKKKAGEKIQKQVKKKKIQQKDHSTYYF